ncbi:substrate-binding domain-containing protein [Nocardia aurea]|uniref:substrate-binding domain-containing protein n=1 Tax=Nocardia aurea TaxID=2144174 RepID=UPI001E2CE7C7|nr:substrate-binding domain-containing protein [Nocardia aurea]
MATDAAARAEAGILRIAMVFPLQGPAGLLGPSCQAVTELALHEFNSADGIIGRQVVAEIVDGGAEPQAVAAVLRRLVAAGAVDAVSGWHISSVRDAVAPVLADRVPYVYTALHEGGAAGRGPLCTGEIPRLQIRPALGWLRDNIGAKRWFIVGNDYVWPRGTARAVARFAEELGLRIVGECFVGLGSGRTARAIPLIERSGCDGVLMLLVGQDAAEFNRVFARCGLHEKLVRFSVMLEENMLMASGLAATRNLFTAAAYFRSLANADTMDLLGRYVGLHGPTAPALNVAAESCYEGLKTLAQLACRAGSLQPDALDRVVDRVAYHGPRGTVEFRGRQAAQSVHLAVADGYDFDVIARL